MQGDDRSAKCRGIAGIKSGVPLFVLVTETDDHDICPLDQSTGADGVHPGALVIMPKGLFLAAQNGDTAIVRRRMISHRRAKIYIQLRLGRAFYNPLPPIAVNFA